jgi:hypothetical protein
VRRHEELGAQVPRRRPKLSECELHALGQKVDEDRVIVPVLDRTRRHAERLGGALDPRQIFAHAPDGVVGRQHESHEPVDAVGGHRRDGVLDGGLGVLGAVTTGELARSQSVEGRLHTGHLFGRPCGQL